MEHGGRRHHDRALRSAEAFLLREEQVVVASNKHWIVVAEPVLTCVLSFALVVWMNATVASPGADLFWWLWFAVVLRTAWCLIEWRRTWFIATDQRLLKITGMVVRKVAMMPLKKVTDVTYDRTIPGQILRYGTFRFETPGQDQAFERIERMPHPHEMYRAIVEYVLGGPDKPAPKKSPSADPTPTRPMKFDLGDRSRSNDEDLYAGGTHERRSQDPDTEPFVIPGTWKRTDDEVTPPPTERRFASEAHHGSHPVQSKTSMKSTHGMLDTDDESRGWWRRYQRRGSDASTRSPRSHGTGRGDPGHGREGVDTGPIIEGKAKRRGNRGSL